MCFSESITDRSTRSFANWVQTMQQKFMSGAEKEQKQNGMKMQPRKA